MMTAITIARDLPSMMMNLVVRDFELSFVRYYAHAIAHASAHEVCSDLRSLYLDTCSTARSAAGLAVLYVVALIPPRV
jgi:hypothetical protein